SCCNSGGNSSTDRRDTKSCARSVGEETPGSTRRTLSPRGVATTPVAIRVSHRECRHGRFLRFLNRLQPRGHVDGGAFSDSRASANVQDRLPCALGGLAKVD